MKKLVFKPRILLIILISIFFLLVPTEKTNAATENYFFIGDSRTYHMMTRYPSARGSFAGKVVNLSAIDYNGYVGTTWDSWFGTNGASRSKLDALSSAPAGTKVIIWLGVNDMNNTNHGTPAQKADLYVQEVQKLANTYKNLMFCQVSVTAVVDSLAAQYYSSLLNNTRIDQFNNELKSKISSLNMANYKYIDINSDLKSYIISNNPTVGDGLHYTEAYYKTISDSIYAKVSKISTDTTPPTLSSINVTSPAGGTYKAGTKITLVSTYSENIYGNASKATITSSTAPKLTVKFGSGSAKATTFSSVSGKTITYTYTIQSGDNGKLAVAGHTGNVYDAAGNKLAVGTKTIGGNAITADTTQPSCTITANVGSTTNASSITYTFTWSETLANNTFTADDITVTNGTKGTFKATTANKVYTLVVTNTGSCKQTVAVAASKCTDAAGNNNTAASKSITIDRTAPSCTITASTGTPTNASSITYTLTWNETLANGTFTQDDITLTNGTIQSFNTITANKVYTLIVTNSGSCTQKVEIAAGKCTDTLGNKNTATSKSITIDKAMPTCTITASTDNITNASSITYTFTWSETLKSGTFTADDITVTNGTKGEFKATTANKVFTLVVTNTGSCTQKVEVAAGKCEDLAGNKNTATSKSITIDRTEPTCTIVANTGDLTNASSVTYTFTWNEVLENNSFTIDDITVTNGTKGEFKATTANKVYTLVVTNSGSCSQTVSIAAGKCKDKIGNGNKAASKTVTIDKTAPTCKITANTADKTNANSITYTFTWSETLANNTFTADDITVTNGTKGEFKATTANKVYTLVVTNSGSCTQKVEVVAGKCTDTLGNKNTAASKTITIDRTVPTCTITANVGDTTSASSITYTFTWSETLANNSFTVDDITITNGTKGEFKATTANKVYTLVVTNSGSCTQKVEVAAGKCMDVVGNSNKAASKSITIDKSSPTCTITANTGDITNLNSITYTFTWNQVLSNGSFTKDDITITNGTAGDFKTVTANKVYTLVVKNSGSYTQKVEVLAEKCENTLGSKNLASSKTVTIDKVAPTCTITANAGSTTNASSITYTFTWNETLANNSFTKDDIQVTNGTKGEFKATTANKVYTLVVTNSGSCTQKVEVAAGKCMDLAGNSSKVASKTITIDRSAPTCTITSNVNSPSNASSVTYTFTWNKNLKNGTFTTDDIQVTNGAKGEFKATTANRVYTLVVTNAGTCTQTVAVAANKCEDEVGNQNKAASKTISIDRTVPTITSVTKTPETQTEDKVTLKVEAQDNESGIKEYSFNDGKTWQTSKEKSYYKNTEGIKIKVKDNAGNIKTYEEIINITNIENREDLKKGDINEDTKINILDVIAVIRHIGATEGSRYYLNEKQRYIADINDDGKINIADVIGIIRLISAK